MSENSSSALEMRIKELEQLVRLASNTFVLVSEETTIKGTHAPAVAEILSWISSMHQNAKAQLEDLKALLPKPEAPQVVEATIVPEGVK